MRIPISAQKFRAYKFRIGYLFVKEIATNMQIYLYPDLQK